MSVKCHVYQALLRECLLNLNGVQFIYLDDPSYFHSILIQATISVTRGPSGPESFT